MKWIGFLSGIGTCFALLAGSVVAQGPVYGPCSSPPGIVQPGCPIPQAPGTTMPGATVPPTTAPGTTAPAPGMAAPGAEQAPATDAFAQAPEAGTQAEASFNPAMFGDLIGITPSRLVLLPKGATQGALPRGTPFRVVHGNIIAAAAPLPFRTSFKIAEGENPRPQDRVYVAYTFYNNVTKGLVGVDVPSSDLHRETLGFEKTLFDGNASIGLRIPMLELTGNGDVEDTHISDLSIILKYALINDRATGNVLSTGLVITTPTGEGLQIAGESTLNSTIFEPFVGYVFSGDSGLFVQGFSSVSVPTDMRDVTLLFNSVAFGYWMYRRNDSDSLLTGVVPVAEFHVDTPLNHRGTDHTPIGFPDAVNFTGGVHLYFHRAEVGAAVGVPFTGPKPYDLEAQVNLTYRW
jgi:hypothetical protein